MRNILTFVLLLGAAPAGAVDLMGVYELAEQNDPELRAADYQRRATGENPNQARAALLPQISGSASKTIGSSTAEVAGVEQPSSDEDTENYSVQLRQSIYDDANYGELGRARAQATQADWDYESARQTFLLRVAERYFNVLTALDSVRFAKAEETALKRQFEQAEQRFEVGLAAVTDVHEARATYDAARARVIVAENVLEDAQEALREVTGAAFERFDQLTEDVPMDPPDPANAAEWVDLALANNPDLEASRLSTDIARSGVRTARSGHLPSLDAVASYNVNNNNEFLARDPETQEPLGTTTFRTEGWTVGLELNVPIFSGFAVSSRTRQARYNLFAADETLDLTQRQVVRQTENAYRGVMAGIQEVEARRQALVSARSALEATQAGFEVGTRTIVDVLLSEQRFYQAQRDYSQARHEFILNRLRLEQAAGVLDAEDLERINELLG